MPSSSSSSSAAAVAALSTPVALHSFAQPHYAAYNGLAEHYLQAPAPGALHATAYGERRDVQTLSAQPQLLLHGYATSVAAAGRPQRDYALQHALPQPPPDASAFLQLRQPTLLPPPPAFHVTFKQESETVSFERRTNRASIERRRCRSRRPTIRAANAPPAIAASFDEVRRLQNKRRLSFLQPRAPERIAICCLEMSTMPPPPLLPPALTSSCSSRAKAAAAAARPPPTHFATFLAACVC